MKKTLSIFLLILLGSAWASSNESTQGGNLSIVNVSPLQNSSWYGICGLSSTQAVTPLTISAIPGSVNCTTINDGSSSCQNGVNGSIFFLFSNSSIAISSLSAGNLSLLDNFITLQNQNASSTFTSNSSLPLPGFGALNNVPSIFTNSLSHDFKMWYLNDQVKDIVIATNVISQEPGFNGSFFNFQAMLPTRNSTTTQYYLTVELSCNPSNINNGGGSGGGNNQGGGGSGVPYYNESKNNSLPQPPSQPCITKMICGQWGQCQNGSTEQMCSDINNCTNMSLFKVAHCQPFVPPNASITTNISLPVPGLPNLPQKVEETNQYLYCFPLVLLLLLIPLVLWLLRMKIFVAASGASARSILMPSQMMNELRLKPGDSAELSLWGKKSYGMVGLAPVELTDKNSPAKATGKFLVLGKQVINELGIKAERKRKTGSKGYSLYGEVIWLKIRKRGDGEI